MQGNSDVTDFFVSRAAVSGDSVLSQRGNHRTTRFADKCQNDIALRQCRINQCSLVCYRLSYGIFFRICVGLARDKDTVERHLSD